MRVAHWWSLSRSRVELGRRTLVMAVLNASPDSFSDDSTRSDVASITDRGLLAEDRGADIIDVGGFSSRPGASWVSPELEIQRVVPVIERLVRKVRVPVSVDTWRSEVARRSLEAGAEIVNDISGFRFDRQMAATVKASRAGVILMHSSGALDELHSRSVRKEPAEVVQELAHLVESAQEHGVNRESIVLDPGIGFGKSTATNIEMLKLLPTFAELGYPLLVGPSKKYFRGPDGPRSLRAKWATASAVALAVAFGTHIVRIHDVAEMRSVVDLADSVCFPKAP